MKVAIDFTTNGPLAKAIAQVLGLTDINVLESSDVVLTDSTDKLLRYLQQTDKKVIQICHSHNFPMEHLLEDYPERLKVIDVRKSSSVLVPLLQAIKDLQKE